jgi:hypothetical protein
MNIKITLDLLRPDKSFILKWLRPDQRATLAHLVMLAQYDDLKRLNGERGPNDKV